LDKRGPAFISMLTYLRRKGRFFSCRAAICLIAKIFFGAVGLSAYSSFVAAIRYKSGAGSAAGFTGLSTAIRQPISSLAILTLQNPVNIITINLATINSPHSSPRGTFFYN
jgi:hypothetical protein